MNLVTFLFCGAYILVGCAANRLLTYNNPEQFLNVCLNGLLHKDAPGPEAQLFDKCSPWKSRSCCTEDITKSIHVNDTWYKMDWSHCPVKLSDRCRGHFVQDLCFYECSPNVGPWLVAVDQKIRKERFVGVPLCQTECDAWWDDCKDDFTCIENWGRGFDWSSGTAKCPLGSTCKPFSEIYKNSSDFCEKVWDHSWEVVPDSNPDGCFLMWWSDDSENPNTQVALRKATQIVSAASHLCHLSTSVTVCFTMVSILLSLFVRL